MKHKSFNHSNLLYITNERITSNVPHTSFPLKLIYFLISPITLNTQTSRVYAAHAFISVHTHTHTHTHTRIHTPQANKHIKGPINTSFSHWHAHAHIYVCALLWPGDVTRHFPGAPRQKRPCAMEKCRTTPSERERDTELASRKNEQFARARARTRAKLASTGH